MTAEQARQLAELMSTGRSTRPEGVVIASLEYRDEHARLVAIWRDERTLTSYLAQAPVPRGTELMRKIGVEPTVIRFDVLDLG